MSTHVPRNTPQSQTVRHTGENKRQLQRTARERQPDPQKGSHITGSHSSYVNVQSMVHPHSVPNPDLRSSRITSAVLPANTTLPLPSPCTTHTLGTRSFGYPYPATRCIPTRSFGCPQCSHPVLPRTILSPDRQSYPGTTCVRTNEREYGSPLPYRL